MIKDFIENSVLLSDGAMGTYYSLLTGDSTTRVEVANLTSPETVLKIHREYIGAGSKLIRTNSFAANTHSLDIKLSKLKEIIEKAWDLASEAASNKEVFIAGDIGPIPSIDNDGEEISEEDRIKEYCFIADIFLDRGCRIFNFETFSSTDSLEKVIDYIRSRINDVYIMVQYSVDKSGYSRKGLTVDELSIDSKELGADLIGLNCGSGPTHLVSHINQFKTAYANAGYPEIINNRTVFNSSPKYFADVMSSVIDGKVKIIGGCCGTTPDHIKALNSLLKGESSKDEILHEAKPKVTYSMGKSDKNLLIAVELDPPFKPDLTKIISSAKDIKEMGVDIITLADSPSGRMRLNPITVASRIKRDVGVEVMPHICCRDRNLIALKSDILAAHTEGIRDLLIVTGDPIPLEERDEVKKVFNCNSVTLMQQVDSFNSSVVSDSPFKIGGALNLSSKNLDAQVLRMMKKIDAGARLFLTQPLYEDRSIEFLLGIDKPKDVKILAGIMPIVTYKNAQFLNNEFPGISIPDSMISRFRKDMSREEGEILGIEISVEIVNRLKGLVDGFYFITPFHRTNMISEIIKQAELR